MCEFSHAYVVNVNVNNLLAISMYVVVYMLPVHSGSVVTTAL